MQRMNFPKGINKGNIIIIIIWHVIEAAVIHSTLTIYRIDNVILYIIHILYYITL